MIKIVFKGEQDVAVKKKYLSMNCFVFKHIYMSTFLCFFMTTVLPYKEDILIGITTLFWKKIFLFNNFSCLQYYFTTWNLFANNIKLILRIKTNLQHCFFFLNVHILKVCILNLNKM